SAHRASRSFPTRRSSDLRLSPMTKRFPSGTVSGPKYFPPHSSEPTVEGISISGGLLMKESLVLVPLTITPGSPSRHCTVSPSVRSEEHTSELQSRFDLVC